MEKSKITVIGCGWMGLPLCESLSADGHEIKTTTTTVEKVKQLTGNFNTQLFDVNTQTPDQTLLFCDVIIYTIPPQAEGVVEHFFHAVDPDQKIIFISSTSVYGKDKGIITEDSELSPESEKGKILELDEKYLRSHFKNLVIIRPGGLFNEIRHPIHSLQGKSGLTTGEELLHLVHLDDCLFAIKQIIYANHWSQDFNLTNDLRMEKKTYYKERALKLGLIPPSYINNPKLNPTSISNEKSKIILGLVYKSE